MHTEAIHISRRFDPLIISDSDKQSKYPDKYCIYIADELVLFITFLIIFYYNYLKDNRDNQRNSESLLIIDTIKSENDRFKKSLQDFVDLERVEGIIELNNCNDHRPTIESFESLVSIFEILPEIDDNPEIIDDEVPDEVAVIPLID
ncbi:25967_t:CDS:2, partial [Dentiscutata erythropus]